MAFEIHKRLAVFLNFGMKNFLLKKYASFRDFTQMKKITLFWCLFMGKEFTKKSKKMCTF